MKATGIVRRIDDLGRVVIPKEIRRTLRLREGTPLEIFTDREGEIILKKYSPMMELTAFSGQYAEAMAQSSGLMVCITDRDQVVAVAGGPKKELLSKTISRVRRQPGTNVFCIWCRMRWKGSMRRWSCRSSARGMPSEAWHYFPGISGRKWVIRS